MRRVAVLFFILAMASPVASETPIGYNIWAVDSITNRIELGAPFANYRAGDGTFVPVDNTWQLEGDSVFYCYTSNIKTRVNKNGQVRLWVTYNDVNYELAQIPFKLIWLKPSNGQFIDVIPGLSWPTPSLDSNVIRWDFPGFYYAVIKENSTVHDRVFFKPGFLDSAVTLYNQRSDSLDIALASVLKYEITNLDDPTAEVDVAKKRLKQLGDYYLDLGAQELNYPGVDSTIQINDTTWVHANPPVKVRQYWKKQGQSYYCAEYVPMSTLKKIHEFYPTATVWHNSSLSWGAGSNDAQGTWLNYIDNTTNEDGIDYEIYDDGNGPTELDRYVTLVKWDALRTTLYGQEVSAATIQLEEAGVTGDPTGATLGVTGIIRYWDETQATWDEAVTSTNWGSSGCYNTSTDMTGTEYDTETYGTYSGGGSRYEWDVTTYMQAYDNTDTSGMQGFKFYMDGAQYNGITFDHDGNTPTARRPSISVTYSAAGGGGGDQRWRRRRLLIGERDETDRYFNGDLVCRIYQ